MKRQAWGLGVLSVLGMWYGARAQSPDYVAMITKAKADLHAAGVQTEGAGPCGPFQIATLTASRIPGGYVLDKSTGARCEWPAKSGHFFAPDVIGFLDGRIFVVLAGAENTPQWMAAGTVDVLRLRSPVMVSVNGPTAATPQIVVTRGPQGEPGPQGPPGPRGDPGKSVDVSDLQARVESLEVAVKALPTTCLAEANIGFAHIKLVCHLQ